MPTFLSVEGLEFRAPPGKWEYGAVLFSEHKVLKLDYPHKNKQNTLEGEIRILEDLNRQGAISVPRLVSSGVLTGASYPEELQGKRYMIIERIPEEEGVRPIDVLRAFIEVKECGYLHGDLKPSNVVFDGQGAVLVDFDQTVSALEVAQMSMSELLQWGDAHNNDRVWRQCYSLRHQLEVFAYSQHASDPRLDIRAYPLTRVGRGGRTPTP